jgi:hypothetical protein
MIFTMNIKTIKNNQKSFSYWKFHLLGTDPGLIRLQFGLKTVLTVAFSCFVMSLIIQAGSYGNLTPIMLTGLVGLQSIVLINDKTTKEKKITTCLFPVLSALSITLSTAFSIVGYFSANIMLVVIAFLAFYVQRFGARYVALGMISFLTFYFSLMYMQGLTFSDLPWYYAGVVVGPACGYIINFFVFKDKAQKNSEETVRVDEQKKQPQRGLYPTTQKGLQAALVSGVAIVIGHVVSPTYPYWTVLAAILVILGTNTVGDTAKKALHRCVGTIFGAIAGLTIGSFISGPMYVVLSLLAISIFTAYYLMAHSYAVFIFWITMLLSMAFEALLGGITVQILGLRVIDTLIGSGLSVLVVIFLFRHQTNNVVKKA